MKTLKFIITLILISTHFYISQGQTYCTDLDFETGTLNGWTTGGNVALVSTGVDYYGGFPVSASPGNFSVQIGNKNTSTPSFISRSFLVTSANSILTYQYAMVLLDYPHSAGDASNINIDIFDGSSQPITCAHYKVYAEAGGPPGFLTSPRPAESNYSSQCCYTISYKPWTPVSIDLAPYIGQTVTIRIDCDWCVYDVDWGYCYMDFGCSGLQVQQACQSGTATIFAPPGFQSYSWTGPGIVSGSTSDICNVNVSGTYNVAITSLTGCSINLDTNITILPSNVIPTINGNLNICQGGSTNLTASGGITYLWSESSTTPSITVSPPTATTYTVTVSNASGCSASTNVLINVYSVNPEAGPDLTICPLSNAFLDASTSTGSPPLTFAWNNGINTATQTVSPATTTTYTVTVTSNSCTATDAVTVTVTNNMVLTVSPNASICLGGSTPLTASGATNYTWSPATGLSATTGANVTANPTVTTTYTVVGITGTCSGTTTVTVSVNNIAVSVTPTNPTICSGNSTTLTATGGSNYTWSPATGLSSTSGASVVANPTSTTTYNIDITDINGCSATTTATVDVVTVTATATSTNENCGQSNGSATVTPTSNCTQTLTYAWNTSPFPQTTTTATNLSGGTYTVTVSCGGCSATASAVITNLAGPSVQIVNITNATCSYANGGAVSLASGGTTSTYYYNWSNGQSGASISNVYAGTFTITVTDGVGCTAVNTVNITNTPGPTASITGINFASCGTSDGSANLTVNGGGMPYTFQWNPTGQTTQNLSNVPTGNYTVTITDANTCSTTTQVFIGEDLGPSGTTISDPEYCDQLNGTATVNATGGLGVYTYLWSDSNGQTTSTATGLAQGTYTVTVSDGGCSTVETVNVMEIPGPNAGFSAQPQVLTIMDGPVSFLDNSSGNVVNWDWTLGDGSLGSGVSFDHQYTNIGIYLVTLIITDNNGCQDTTIDTIEVKDIYTLYIPNVFTPNGDGINDYFFPQGVSVDPDNFDMWIFDRWGNMVYHTSSWLTNRSEGWNGTQDNKGSYNDVVMDVYVYRILTKEIMGPKHEYIGRVALIP